MDGFLTGRTAVVTGGGRGIGAATAVALARAGVSHVALVARTEGQLEATAEQVRRAGAAATVFAVDLWTCLRWPSSRWTSPRPSARSTS